MPNLPKLNLPPIHLRGKKEGDRTYIWDSVRKMFLVLTPEEWVRQHILGYLINHLHRQPQQISLEHPVNLNGMAQRADIVVFGNDAKAEILYCRSIGSNADRINRIMANVTIPMILDRLPDREASRSSCARSAS